jgi:hypothetical protein
MPEAPEIFVTLHDCNFEKPIGASKAAQEPMAAAIANSFTRATGRRLRDLPFTPGASPRGTRLVQLDETGERARSSRARPWRGGYFRVKRGSTGSGRSVAYRAKI